MGWASLGANLGMRTRKRTIRRVQTEAKTRKETLMEERVSTVCVFWEGGGAGC